MKVRTDSLFFSSGSSIGMDQTSNRCNVHPFLSKGKFYHSGGDRSHYKELELLEISQEIVYASHKEAGRRIND